MSIGKRVRFEVFKRDSFKCQYCGATAPDVLLEVDHIQPSSKEGSDEILNLITSCEACNRGKSDHTLDDQSAVAKQRTQLERLQDRREQLEMMIQWSEGLADVHQQAVEWLFKKWQSLAPGFSLTDHGKQRIRKWSRQYSIDELARAMEISADTYLKRAPRHPDVVTEESWTIAFGKIGAIATVTRQESEDPGIRDVYYLRGIIRRNLGIDGYRMKLAFDYLNRARLTGIPIDELRRFCGSTGSWSRFEDDILEWIKHAEKDS
jgi:hypothetical protein